MQEKNAYEAPMTTGQLDKKPSTKKPTDAGWLLGCFGALLLASILIGMILPATQQIRGPHPRTMCLNQMRQISLAMLNYESANGHFLPAYIADEDGKPMHSWRVLLLPYLEQEALYNQYSFDEPWNGPNNSKLHDVIVPGFQCSSVGRGEQETNTSYRLVTGKGTAFDGDHETTFREVSDGTSNTLTIVEVANSDTHWMEPVDLPLDEALARFSDPDKAEQCCNHPGTFNISLMDGSTHSIGFPISAENLKALITIDGGEIVNIEDL